MVEHNANTDITDTNAKNAANKSTANNSKINNSKINNSKINISNCHSEPLALTSPKQRQGSHFEQLACEYLQAEGLLLLAKNWYQPKVGELDLVMLEVADKWSTLVFIEVRQRKRSSFGNAALSITTAKQRKIIKTAQYYLSKHPEYADCECRFDVVAYDVDQAKGRVDTCPPEWLIGAFVAQAW